MIKLGIVATHPIQYHAPLFRHLAGRPELQLIVYFGLIPNADQQGVGFGQPFVWDVPLLAGYDWKVLPNTANRPNLDSFMGIRTPSVRQHLIRDQIEVVLITGWQTLSLVQAIWACHQLRIPCMLRAESNAIRIRSFTTRILHRFLLPHFQAYLVIGKSNRDFYHQYSVSDQSMYHSPYFVENHFFADQVNTLESERWAMRRAWGISDDQIVFLFCGKLIAKKHPLDLFKAAVAVMHEDAHLHILVVGDGELLEACRTFANAYAVPATFVGFKNQSQLPKAYAAADCLVLPSDARETWGLVVNEAMACGLPAIVSDEVGCGPDLIEPGHTGWVFPRGNIEALKNIIRETMSQRAQLHAMGRKAQQHTANYSVETAVDGVMTAIQSITSN